MTAGRRAIAVVAIVASVVIAGCAPSDRPEDRIALENRTTTPVTVDVNGGWAGTYDAGAVANVPITGHGGPPYHIEVRSPSGALLTEITFSAADAQGVASGSTRGSTGGSVPCGWIQISYGIQVVPSAGVPAQDPTGPCP